MKKKKGLIVALAKIYGMNFSTMADLKQLPMRCYQM